MSQLKVGDRVILTKDFMPFAWARDRSTIPKGTPGIVTKVRRNGGTNIAFAENLTIEASSDDFVKYEPEEETTEVIIIEERRRRVTTKKS